MKNIIVIGAGLTGLTLGFLLKRRGHKVTILEKDSRTGGAIQTHTENGYVFEEGPNTGIIANPEVAELFELLNCKFEIANEQAKKRLILKDNKWYPLPNSAVSFLKTPLFTTIDKFRIAFEPLRKKGDNPNESVASLASRRIGQSFVDYAVNPFISGIYAGDPNLLTTKYALPKLYNLEQNYGSFIRGSYKKSREYKSERDKKATRQVFSVKGGLSQLIKNLTNLVGSENIICEATDVRVSKISTGYQVNYEKDNETNSLNSAIIISTIGAYELPVILPFIAKKCMDNITSINYAKVVQVSVALKKNALHKKYISFGGLIPKKENRKLLGVLFPSYCFCNRSPFNCSTLAIYLGGIRNPELFDLSDDDISLLVKYELKELFEISEENINFMRIFKHPYAIPQYEKSTKKRLDTIHEIQINNPGLIIAGNLRDGIGMADRIRQAFDIAKEI